MTDESTEKTYFYGIYKGQVVNNNDLEGLGRITALVPQVLGTTTPTAWAWPCLPVGVTTVPACGSPVWVSFEGGDIEHPLWLGVWRI